MKTLVESYDPTEETCADLLKWGFDVRSYLEMVDRLVVRLGGEKEHRRAARLVCEEMLDTKPEDCEPRPEWFEAWWQSDEIRTLRSKVSERLSELIRGVSKVNSNPDACCYLDEGWVYDCRVETFDDVATMTIDRMEIDVANCSCIEASGAIAEYLREHHGVVLWKSGSSQSSEKHRKLLVGFKDEATAREALSALAQDNDFRLRSESVSDEIYAEADEATRSLERAVGIVAEITDRNEENECYEMLPSWAAKLDEATDVIDAQLENTEDIRERNRLISALNAANILIDNMPVLAIRKYEPNYAEGRIARDDGSPRVHEEMDYAAKVGSFTVGAREGTDAIRYTVSVLGDEGRTPHFHVFDEPGRVRRGRQKRIVGTHACVRLLERKYLKRGVYRDELSAEVRAALDSFMRAVRTEDDHETGLGKTNFQYAVALWNEESDTKGSPRWIDPQATRQPDYTTIVD